MRLMLTGLGLVISLASIAMGVANLVIDRPAGVALSEENIVLVIIAGSFALLGALSTRKQAGVAAILDIFAGSLAAIAAEPGHGYVYAYAGVMVMLGIVTMLAALTPPRPAPAIAVESEIDIHQGRALPSARHLRARARRHRTRATGTRSGAAALRRQIRARLRETVEQDEHVEPEDNVAVEFVEASVLPSTDEGRSPAETEHDDR